MGPEELFFNFFEMIVDVVRFKSIGGREFHSTSLGILEK